MGVGDFAFGGDDVDGAADDGGGGAVGGADFFVCVGEEGEGEVVLGFEAGVGIRRLTVDAEDGYVLILEVLPIVTDFAELLRSSGGVVGGVKDHD